MPDTFRHTINTLVRNSGYDPAKMRAELGWMDEAIHPIFFIPDI
jgi:hypothetical protein